jgi:hypothetical protein
MGRIAGIERERIGRLRVRYAAVFGTLILVVVLLFAAVLRVLWERGTFDLLSILSEDREIVREFMGDVLIAFVADLPYGLIAWGILAAAALAVVSWVTARQRAVMRRKQAEIEKYLGNRDTIGVQGKEEL